MKHNMRNQLTKQWNLLKGEVCTRWNKLTENDFRRIAGQREQLILVIQQRYAIARHEADRQVEEWTTYLGI